MSKELKVAGAAVEVEMVSVPLEVARDLIAALSAENARLRKDLKETKEISEHHEGRADYWSKRCDELEKRNIRLLSEERNRRAAARKAELAAKKGESQ